MGCLSLQWHHNEHDGCSNHQHLGCLLSHLFWCRSKKTSKLNVTSVCDGIDLWPEDSYHKGPLTWKVIPFDGILMLRVCYWTRLSWHLTVLGHYIVLITIYIILDVLLLLLHNIVNEVIDNRAFNKLLTYSSFSAHILPLCYYVWSSILWWFQLQYWTVAMYGLCSSVYIACSLQGFKISLVILCDIFDNMWVGIYQ